MFTIKDRRIKIAIEIVAFILVMLFLINLGLSTGLFGAYIVGALTLFLTFII